MGLHMRALNRHLLKVLLLAVLLLTVASTDKQSVDDADKQVQQLTKAVERLSNALESRLGSSGGLNKHKTAHKETVKEDADALHHSGGSMGRALCGRTRGSWCYRFHKQQELPGYKHNAQAVEKQCKNNCNGVGNCNFDIGLCDCPAGWAGDDCSQKHLRPCTNRHANDDEDAPISHLDERGFDKNLTADGWTASRCSGICDADTAICWCDSKEYGFRQAPPGSPYGYRQHLLGSRTLTDGQQINTDREGHELTWGHVPYNTIYGPKGWCNASKPEVSFGCQIDGSGGALCDQPLEMYCPNQCTGRGTCYHGFCKCDQGWYGSDCSTPTAAVRGQAAAKPAQLAAGPHLETTLVVPAALHEPPPARKRPLIYVYNMPPNVTMRMHQYRLSKSVCAWRVWHDGNVTSAQEQTYGIETLLHEMLLQSPHRTLDPEEADFFYVPVYASCYAWPIYGYADGPWWGPPMGPRVMHMSLMQLEAKRWVQQQYPYWNRSGGRDHIWLFSHDEGACWAPIEVYNSSIMLTHWGRMDEEHESNTAYGFDNYTAEHYHKRLQPKGWLHQIKGHPCYDPAKDLVIPAYKPPHHYEDSALVGAQARERDILAFFRGDMGQHRLAWYSRGIRQKLYKCAEQEKWWEKHRIAIGTRSDVKGSYSQILSRSTFCLVLPGDGWSARAEDAVLHGCIPVVVMDNVHAVFESILDWDSFSIRIPENMAQHLPIILQAVPGDRIARMQRNLQQVWHRFAYIAHPLLQRDAKHIKHAHEERAVGEKHASKVQGPAASMSTWVENDALATIMQWLYGRIGRGREGGSSGGEQGKEQPATR